MLPVLYMPAFLLLILSNTGSTTHVGRYSCSIQRNAITSVGVVVDLSTRVGKEQEIAMNIAVQDIYRESCTQLALHFQDSYESPALATSTALKLIDHEKVQALVGTLSLPQAAVLSETHKNFLDVPVLILTPIAIPTSFEPALSYNLIQMANNVFVHMQCLAAIIGYFQWRKVTIIYEQSNSFSLDSSIISALSDSLKAVDVTIECHVAFPPIFSSSNPEFAIEKELRKLRSGRNRIFLVLHSSLQLATCLFEKANQLGMLDKGFVWMVSDEIASLLDSIDSSVLASMQGVLGYRTKFLDTGKSYKNFKVKFEQHYLTKYPGDPGTPNPSLYAMRAYDVIQSIGKARNDAAGKFNTEKLLSYLLSSNFVGLSGSVSFRNGELIDQSTFQIINVVGNGYKQLAFWSSESGFSKELTHDGGMDDKSVKSNLPVELSPIYWPGGQQTTPRGWTLGISYGKPLRIGVPASGAFHQFVNVSIDKAQNMTLVTGFAVDVFNASLKYLPYDLPFVLVPFYGTYEELVAGIHQKTFDAAIGDINILEERYQWADFTQPYVKSGMNMVVTAKQDKTKEMWTFMMVFDWKMWVLIPLLGLFIGFVVWLIERGHNPDFGNGSISEQVGTVIWFSFTVLLFVQKESPRSNWSKIVLAPWYFLVLMLTIYFTAALTSLMTISQLLPSVNDVETLRRENAGVGCNRNSFLCTYLVDVLQFKPENVKLMRSIDEYPQAFQSGEIKAAFIITSHAQVFLAKYCSGYTLAGPTYNFGGLGFAFSKGSMMSRDISQAMLKATERGEIQTLETDMLARCHCSTSTISHNSTTVGPKPFSGLLLISGCAASVALLVRAISSAEKRWKISSGMREHIMRRMCAWVSLSLSSNRTSQPTTPPPTTTEP